MRGLTKGIIALLGALLITILILPLQIIYSLGYSVFLCLKINSFAPFFEYWFRMIKGVLYALGHILKEIALALDFVWNVFGELIEDLVTYEDETFFSKEKITVSSSLGDLERDGKLNKFGKFLVKILNIIFNQKNHCIDSILWYEVKKDFWNNIEKRKSNG